MVKNILHDYLSSFVLPPMIWLFTSELQYALLRQYLPEKGWWMLAFALGASIPALMGMPFSGGLIIISVGFFPSLATAPVWWDLFKKQSQTIETQTVPL